jgi:hypothetical protein
MTTQKNKAGPWSKKDRAFIRDNADSLSPEEIAKELQRNVNAVEEYMRANSLISSKKKLTANSKVEYDIRGTPHWRELQRQFTEDELESFMYHWNNVIKQFRDDVLHTEELQIIDMIKLELLMNRLLTSERSIKARIKELEFDISSIRSNGLDTMTDDDKEEVFNIERQVSALYSSIESINKEYLENLREKTKILDKLKATREQRIKEIQSGKETMAGWIRSLLMNPEMGQKIGRDMEKMRLATQVEVQRLSDLFTYADGVVDRPLLTPETVMRED